MADEKDIKMSVEVNTDKAVSSLNKLGPSIDQAKDKVSGLSESLEGFSKQVSTVSEGAGSSLSGLLGPIGQVDSAFKMLAVNPVIAIVAVFVGTLMTLYEALNETKEGSAQLSEIGSQLGQVWKEIVSIIATLAEALLKVLMPIIQTVINGIEMVVNGFNKLFHIQENKDLIGQAAQAGKIKENQIKLQRESNELDVQRSEIEVALAKARLQGGKALKEAEEKEKLYTKAVEENKLALLDNAKAQLALVKGGAGEKEAIEAKEQAEKNYNGVVAQGYKDQIKLKKAAKKDDAAAAKKKAEQEKKLKKKLKSDYESKLVDLKTNEEKQLGIILATYNSEDEAQTAKYKEEIQKQDEKYKEEKLKLDYELADKNITKEQYDKELVLIDESNKNKLFEINKSNNESILKQNEKNEKDEQALLNELEKDEEKHIKELDDIRVTNIEKRKVKLKDQTEFEKALGLARVNDKKDEIQKIDDLEDAKLKQNDDREVEEIKKAEGDAQLILQIRQKYADQEVEIQKEASDAITKINKAEADNKLALLDKVKGGLDQAAQALGENTSAGKDLAIASASINIFEAMTKALNSMPFPANIPAVLATAANGFATLKKLMSVKVPNHGTSGNAPTAPTMMVAPQIYGLGGQSLQQVQTQAQTQKVIVTQQDITRQQNNSSNIQRVSVHGS